MLVISVVPDYVPPLLMTFWSERHFQKKYISTVTMWSKKLYLKQMPICSYHWKLHISRPLISNMLPVTDTLISVSLDSPSCSCQVAAVALLSHTLDYAFRPWSQYSMSRCWPWYVVMEFVSSGQYSITHRCGSGENMFLALVHKME